MSLIFFWLRWCYWFLFGRGIPVTIITDCCDDNARGRQLARFAALFPGSQITFIGVSSDVEAGFNLVDVLDAYAGRSGVIVVNVAPRNGRAKRWPNGTPFGVLKVGNATIFSTVDGATLSLVRKLFPSDVRVDVFDIPTVLEASSFDHELRDFIATTQFRSFEFLPRIAQAYWRGHHFPSKVYPLGQLAPECEPLVATTDNFGNAKTTLLPDDVGFERNAVVQFRIGGLLREFVCYPRLKDIPDGHTGLVIGSSGFGSRRFLEIMVQGGSAARTLSLSVESRLDQTAQPIEDCA